MRPRRWRGACSRRRWALGGRLPPTRSARPKRWTWVVEPRGDGRWYERGDDARTCDWGRVLLWEPHSRLVLTWEITADWQHDPSLKTEVEVRFIGEGKDGTRVELEHRHLDLYGARRDEMR